jgi:hypothetical protein
MQLAITAAVVARGVEGQRGAAMNITTNDSRTTKIEKLSANIPLDLLHELDQLVQANGPFATRHALLVAAIRVGVDELTTNPSRLIAALGHRTEQR